LSETNLRRKESDIDIPITRVMRQHRKSYNYLLRKNSGLEKYSDSDYSSDGYGSDNDNNNYKEIYENGDYNDLMNNDNVHDNDKFKNNVINNDEIYGSKYNTYLVSDDENDSDGDGDRDGKGRDSVSKGNIFIEKKRKR